MPWKKYEINIKCRKCKTHRKMVFEWSDRGPSFMCLGCKNYYCHQALRIIFDAGVTQGRKDLQREMRDLMGASSYQDAVEAARRTSQLEHTVEKLEEQVP